MDKQNEPPSDILFISAMRASVCGQRTKCRSVEFHTKVDLGAHVDVTEFVHAGDGYAVYVRVTIDTEAK